MQRFRLKPLDQCLLAVTALALLAGWLIEDWTLGVTASVIAIGIFALRRCWAAIRIVVGRSPAATDPRAIALALPAPSRRRVGQGKELLLVEKMIVQGRAALLLRPQIAPSLSADDRTAAQANLDEAMAIVPQGGVAVRARCYDALDEENAAKAERLINVEGFYLDRYAVSNEDYLQFVEDGGYEQMSLWDEAIWPAVLGFVDQTGQPGPRYWEHGSFIPGKEHHPVVGVSWYEACAYARWAGKRLPTDAEWVKAGTWPVFASGSKPVQRRFPWGDALDRKRANLWGSGFDTTVPVHALPDGASVNGVHQLVGNVWEWTSSAFGAWEPASRKIETKMPLRSIRGGAFDTYFEAQAHCQFQSGEAPLARKHNIGFRCALGFCDVIAAAEDSAPETGSIAETKLEEVPA